MQPFVLRSIILSALLSTTLFAAIEKPKPASVFARPAQLTELSQLLTYPARVSPKVNTQILAETDGIVTKVLAPLGQKVKKGQRILTITHTDPAYQYAPATVHAPVGGIVSQVEVSEGTTVVKSQKLITITDPSQILILVEIPALDVPLIQAGHKGEFHLSGNPVNLNVKVRGISPYVDPATGTATCELELDSAAPTPILAPGMIGQVIFKTHVHLGFSVPDSAINYKGEEPYVRIIEGGKSKRVDVKLGERLRGYVEILSGLKENALVVERASRFISDGEEVSLEDGPK